MSACWACCMFFFSLIFSDWSISILESFTWEAGWPRALKDTPHLQLIQRPECQNLLNHILLPLQCSCFSLVSSMFSESFSNFITLSHNVRIMVTWLVRAYPVLIDGLLDTKGIFQPWPASPADSPGSCCCWSRARKTDPGTRPVGSWQTIEMDSNIFKMIHTHIYIIHIDRSREE